MPRSIAWSSGVIATTYRSARTHGQNLLGNWQAKGFNLPQRLREAIPTIDDHETVVVMHNDAVVQGIARNRTTRRIELGEP